MNIFSSQTEKVKRHLEKEGVKIKTEHERRGEKTYARYKLVD
jgi:hypothetical protein